MTKSLSTNWAWQVRNRTVLHRCTGECCRRRSQAVGIGQEHFSLLIESSFTPEGLASPEGPWVTLPSQTTTVMQTIKIRARVCKIFEQVLGAVWWFEHLMKRTLKLFLRFALEDAYTCKELPVYLVVFVSARYFRNGHSCSCSPTSCTLYDLLF